MARNSQGQFSLQEQYRDIDVSFARNPITGDVVTLSTEDSIKQSVRLLVLTQFYERPYKPKLGTRLASALFELPGAAILTTMKDEMTSFINTAEPRVIVQSIDVSSLNQFDNNAIAVTVTYMIRGKQKQYNVEILVKRIR